MLKSINKQCFASPSVGDLLFEYYMHCNTFDFYVDLLFDY